MAGRPWAVLLLLPVACTPEGVGASPSATVSSDSLAQTTRPAPPRIAWVDAGIDALRIEPGGREPFELARRKGGWMVVAPPPEGPASAESITESSSTSRMSHALPATERMLGASTFAAVRFGQSDRQFGRDAHALPGGGDAAHVEHAHRWVERAPPSESRS
jgi:hypothetical protein